MELRPLSESLQRKAIEELNEEPNRIDEVFQHIKEWLSKQPHLNVRLDPQVLVAFFRTCKWNLQRIKEKLDYYYTTKSKMPEFFDNRDPLSSQIQKVLNAGIIFFMPKLKIDDLNPRTCLFLLHKVDVQDTPLKEVIKVFFMMLDILMNEDDDMVVSGVTVISDYNGVPTNYLLQLTPPTVQKFTTCFQNAYPVRIKGYHCLNAPTILDTIYHNFCKPLLSSKLQQRVNVVSSSRSQEIFNEYSQILPKEYGGTNGTINEATEEWKNKIETYRDWFLEDAKYVNDEKLRQQKSNLFEQEYGVEGSFRNLLVD